MKDYRERKQKQSPHMGKKGGHFWLLDGLFEQEKGTNMVCFGERKEVRRCQKLSQFKKPEERAISENANTNETELQPYA